MGINFDEMKNKAKNALGQHGDKADQGLDKANEAAKSRFGEHSDKIDSATEKARGYVNTDQGGEGGGQPGEPGGGEPGQPGGDQPGAGPRPPQ